MFQNAHSQSLTESAALLLVACCIGGAASAEEPKSPSLFAQGVISGPANDLSPAFSPDGLTVFFTRSNASYSFVLVSHRNGDIWSNPKIATFSGRWKDLEPTMSPDGSFLIFASNRPSAEVKGPLDGVYNGKTYPGGGGNLWRVDRHGDSWGEPVRLPNSINSSSAVFSPSIAGDDSLYFMQADPSTGTFHLFRSAYRAGTYQAPVKMALGDATTEEVDPAIAPDESFIVYSSRHPQQHDKNRLHIAFHQAGGWGNSIDLGDIVNERGSNIEARLGSDRRTLYFSTNSVPPASPAPTPAEVLKVLQEMQVWANDNENIWYVSLAPWLDERLGH
jgi:WD40-like Beta Propeller Repeat